MTASRSSAPAIWTRPPGTSRMNSCPDRRCAPHRREARGFALPSRLEQVHRQLRRAVRGNGGTQMLLCAIPVIRDTSLRFGDPFLGTDYKCNNDEARSVLLHHVPAGKILRFYDHPLQSRDDDWVDHRQASGRTEVHRRLRRIVQDADVRVDPLSQRWARRQDLRRRHRDHPHQPTAPATTATTAATAAAATSATTAGRAQHDSVSRAGTPVRQSASVSASAASTAAVPQPTML